MTHVKEEFARTLLGSDTGFVPRRGAYIGRCDVNKGTHRFSDIMRFHASVWALTRVLRRSIDHPFSVYIAALFSAALLLSFALFSLAPWPDDEFPRYLSDSFPSKFSSSVVDHFVVFIAISPLVCWLFLIHVAYSHTSSSVEVALLLLRVASCLTVSITLTVIVTEFISRRAILALTTLAYASLGLVYSWIVPIWNWYLTDVRTKGLVTFLPRSTQKLLLQTSLMEWLTDTSFSEKVMPFLPFLLPLTRAEQMKLMEQMPPESQVLLTKPGLLPLLPDSVQRALLPIECASLKDEKKEGAVDASESMVVVDQNTKELQTIKKEEKDRGTSSPLTNAGFDFHQPNVIGTIRSSLSREHVFNEIVSSRVWSGCKELVKIPTSKALHRTAAMSSALLVMQLYASRGSRKVFVKFVQFVVVSALSSVACCAILMRFVQLLDSQWTSARTKLLLCYARRYLLRNGNTAILNQPDRGGFKTLSAAASSVSVLVAALFVLRKLRR